MRFQYTVIEVQTLNSALLFIEESHIHAGGNPIRNVYDNTGHQKLAIFPTQPPAGLVCVYLRMGSVVQFGPARKCSRT